MTLGLLGRTPELGSGLWKLRLFSLRLRKGSTAHGAVPRPCWCCARGNSCPATSYGAWAARALTTRKARLSALLTLGQGFLSREIDLAAHVGGALTGALVAYLWGPRYMWSLDEGPGIHGSSIRKPQCPSVWRTIRSTCSVVAEQRGQEQSSRQVQQTSRSANCPIRGQIQEFASIRLCSKR